MSTHLFRKCCKCGATAYQDKTVPFYRFPKPGKDTILKAKAWAIYCWPEKEWTTVESLLQLHNRSKVLCGRHFEESCFLDSNRKKISKFAVPGTAQYVADLMQTLRGQGSQSLITSEARSSRKQDTPSPECTMNEEITSARKTRGVSILKSLNAEKLSQLSEKERKLYSVCKRTLKEINLLRKNLKHNKYINKIEQYCDSEDIKKLLKMNLTNSFIRFLQSQMKNCPKKPKSRRYTLNEKILALGIYKKSPATYRLLRRFIALPSQGSLIKLLNRVPLRPGSNPQMFKALKNMVEQQLDEQNLCVLLFDEKAIKKDLVEGFQGHGEEHGSSNKVVCNTLVFMVCGIHKKWKQPVAFYLSGEPVTSDRLHILIKEILTQCFKAGVNVLGTVCDMSPVNIEALQKLGATSEKPYFSHEGKEIVTIADPPHLLKSTRNMFLGHNIECNLEVKPDGSIIKGTAKWEHVKDFYGLDNNNPHFVFAPALSEKHLDPNPKQKMRVQLAAQVFSHTVVAGMLAKVASGELPVEALATAILLKNFDELFDALNTDTREARRGKKFSANIRRRRSPHLKLFQDMKVFIKSLKFEGSSRDPSFKSGWIMTIGAVERLWGNLNTLRVRTLSTRRLNQQADCLTPLAFDLKLKSITIDRLRYQLQRNCVTFSLGFGLGMNEIK